MFQFRSKDIPVISTVETLKLMGNPMESYFELPDKYGDFFMVSYLLHYLYFINSPDLAKYMLVENRDNYLLSSHYTQDFRYMVGEAVATTDNEQWKRHHDVVKKGLKPNKINSRIPIAIESINDIMRNDIDPVKGEYLDLDFLLSKFLHNCFLKQVMGIKDEVDIANLMDILNSYKAAGDKFKTRHLFNVPQWYVELTNYNLGAPRKRLYELCQSLLSVNETYADDCIIPILNNSELTEKEKLDEVATLIVGATVTTTTMAWSLYLIYKNQNYLNDMVAKIDEMGDYDPGSDDLESLDFITNVVRESLRLYPPIFYMSRTNIKPDIMHDVMIPKNSFMIVNQYYLHRHPDYWEKPSEFWPERFESKEVRNADYYMPFGKGHHACLGTMYALQLSTLVIYYLLKNYDFNFIHHENTEKLVSKIVLSPGEPFEVSFRKRVK